MLTAIAYVSGIFGALISGMWDLTPPPKGVFSYGNYLDGAIYSAVFTTIGLIFYWVFHLLIGNLRKPWYNLPDKTMRVTWIVCWPALLSYMFSVGLSV